MVGWQVAVLGWERGGGSHLDSTKMGLKSESQHSGSQHSEGGLGCWSGEKAELSAGGQFEVRNWRGALEGGFGVGGTHSLRETQCHSFPSRAGVQEESMKG